MEFGLVCHGGRVPGFFQENLLLNQRNRSIHSRSWRENPSSSWQHHLGPVRCSGKVHWTLLPGRRTDVSLCHPELQQKEMTTPRSLQPLSAFFSSVYMY